MKDVMKPYLDMATAVTQATVAKAVESAQAIIARNVPGSDILDQAQIGSLGLVSINVGGDQDFTDDTGAEAPEVPEEQATQASGAKAKGKKGKGKKGKKGAAAEDTSGSDVLDQAQVGSMGLLSINLGGRQGFIDDQGAEIITGLEAEITSLRADVARLAEALVAIGVIELEHMAVLPRRRARRSTTKRGAKKAPASKAPAKKAPAKKASAKKAPAKKAPAKKASAKKASAKKAPARKAPAKKAPARKAPAKRRRVADDD